MSSSAIILGPLIPALIPITLFLLQRGDETLTDITREEWNTHYDYIIVGGGSAGAVLANRLSEDPSTSVLLLEAGGSESVSSDVPLNAASLQLTAFDWQYKTVTQSHSCYGLQERKSKWPRGKVFGGSSVLNYMLYVRGNRLDFDMWSKDLGLKLWSWEKVFPYFIKSENNTNEKTLNNGYHGSGGYLTTGQAPDHTPIADAFQFAGEYLGYDNLDYNGEIQTGFSISQGTVRNGARCSTSKAYLNDICKERKSNLHILAFSFVTKILIDPSSKTATGVVFDRKERKNIHVYSNKEVILSAGAINSPQLLILSGIGPKEELRRHKIPLVASLPVGMNLQDHIYPAGVHFRIDQEVSLVQTRVVSVSALINYFVNGRGLMTALGGVEGLSFMKTRYTNKSLDFPDFQIHMISGTPASDSGVTFRPTQGVTDEVYNAVYKEHESEDGFSMYPVLLHPKSKGYIKLKSRNPYDHPIIDPKYLTHPQDIKTVVDSMKISIAVGLSPAFKQFSPKLFKNRFPGCHNYKMYSDEYLACVARTYTVTIYHPVGTCRMGMANDSRSVVDEKFRVIGVKNLRVVDASAIPEIPSGNTNAPVIMMAERAADFIKGYNSVEESNSIHVGTLNMPVGPKKKCKIGRTNFKLVDHIMERVVREHALL